MQRGRATGLHTDPSDETFYVLEGELLFHVDGEDRRSVAAGGTIGVRAGVAHAFMAVSELARFLVLNTSGTHDGFFRDGGFAGAQRRLRRRTAAGPRAHGRLGVRGTASGYWGRRRSRT